jgi:hypothetical protein
MCPAQVLLGDLKTLFFSEQVCWNLRRHVFVACFVCWQIQREMELGVKIDAGSPRRSPRHDRKQYAL